MEKQFYTAPLDLGRVISGKAAPRCNLGESISQMLYLLICTRKGDMPGTPEFGCAIWDLQFELIVDKRKWTNAVESSLLQCINRFETRITKCKANVSIEEVEVSYPFRKYPEVKHQAKIQIDAIIAQSEEPYRFLTNIYVSPLAG